MDQVPAHQPEVSQPPIEAWRQFTLLDLMILFTGHGAAMGFMKWYGAFEPSASVMKNSAGIFLALLLILVLGGGISVPVLYLVQFYSRGRDAILSYGEVFGIIIILLAGLSAISFSFRSYDDFFEILAVIVFGDIVFFFCIAPFLFVLIGSAKRPNIPSRWLNWYGYFLVISSLTLAVIYVTSMFIGHFG